MTFVCECGEHLKDTHTNIEIGGHPIGEGLIVTYCVKCDKWGFFSPDY